MREPCHFASGISRASPTRAAATPGSRSCERGEEKEPLMKRLAVGLFVVIIICMLAIAGPAAAKKRPAAAVFHGTWTGGYATQMAPPDGTGDVVELVVSGPNVVVVFGAKATAVAGQVVCAVALDAPLPPSDPGFWGPFPLR